MTNNHSYINGTSLEEQIPDVTIQEVNSEEVQEIISAVPSWILRWGVTLVLSILIAIIILSALIEYPDVVRTGLKVNSTKSPKQVLAKQTARLSVLLVRDGQMVKKNQPLAYFESIGDPVQVLTISAKLKALQGEIFKTGQAGVTLPTELSLGELQSSYQIFYQQYLQYRSTQEKGYYLNKIAFLERDLKSIRVLRSQILKQRKIQEQERSNNEKQYGAYKRLFEKKVISRSEFTEQENKYLASKYPMQQNETSMINNTNTYSDKEKELLDLRHTIDDEKAKFIQALNQCLNQCDNWIMQYILKSPLDGKLSYAGILQENQNVTMNQEVFIVNPGDTDFFGEIQIPQYNMGKVRLGQRTLVKLHSYPFEQYGAIRGRLKYISDAAFRDSVFVAKVSFEKFEQKGGNGCIVLKNGMVGDVDIVTEESSLLQRFFRNITKILTTH